MLFLKHEFTNNIGHFDELMPCNSLLKYYYARLGSVDVTNRLSEMTSQLQVILNYELLHIETHIFLTTLPRNY